MKKISALLLAVLLLAAPAFAADVDGKWSANLDSPNGAITIGYTFKADGATLTGTTTGPDGAEVKIKNGKIDGNKISFMVSIDLGGMPLDIAYTGVINSATEMKLTLDFAGMPVDMVAKKTP
jgi:hypothetical protein